MSRARFSSLALIAALTLVPAVQAQWWNDNDTTFPKFKNAPDYKPKYTRASYYDCSSTVYRWLDAKEYAKVERLYQELLETNPRAGDGQPILAGFLEGLDQYFGAQAEAEARQDMAAWEAAVPKSKVLLLARPVMLQRQAWKARGGGYANMVPEESMKLFAGKLAHAGRSLQETESTGRNSPFWYWAALVVAGSTGEPAARMDRIFEQAATKFPDFLPIYYTRMNYLLPQWGGNWDAVDRFIRDAVRRTKARDGDAFYVWLYLDVVRKTRGEDPFEETRLSWPAMRKGFEDMIARYPDPFNKNTFATFACRARDRETTSRLLLELGDNAKLGQWSEGYTTESCRRFALTGT
jgi:hypothetical protein